MIPENKRIAVANALRAAFGTDGHDDIRELTRGLSTASVFRIVVRGTPYLLRVINRTDAIADPTHQFDCMRSAAEAGLAPGIRYLSVEDRISITDFVEERPFPIAEARTRLADTIRELHALPKFPFRVSYIDTANGFLRRFREAGVLPEHRTRDLFEGYARILEVYPANDRESWVSSHNDLKPDNIVFDGERPWLVDWESAFLNDRYLDLAVVANFVVKSDDDEVEFLDRYFGEAAGEARRAQFFLMRQILHMFYLTLFMPLGSGGKPVDLDAVESPEFDAYHDGLWSGRISMAGSEERIVYARVHMERLRENFRSPRFEDALRIVARGA